MNTLKTDYVNAQLNTAQNTNTKYTMTENSDDTVSFTDVSVYSVTGDTFGAEDMNKTNTEVNLLETMNTVTLSASGWSATVPYTQTVSLSRIKATDSPVISMGVPSTQDTTNYKAMNKAYGMIDRVVSGNGTLTFYCYIKKPTVAINVLVKGV